MIAFVGTFALLAAGYAFLAATGSRMALDTGRPVVVDANGSRALAASLALLAPSSDLRTYDEAIPLLPNGRKLRRVMIDAGKREVAAAYIRLAAAAPHGADPALADALEAIAARDDDAARDALVQLNLHIAGGRSGMGRDGTAVAAVAEALAASCEAEEAALRKAAAASGGGVAGPQIQGVFSHSRGIAYGWLMVLRGALADAPDVARLTVVEAAIPLDALAAAAEHQPLFLFNGSDRAPWAPGHIEIQIAEFARAAAGARALAAAAAKPGDETP